MPTKQEIRSICEGTSSSFAESVLDAYEAIFEQEEQQAQQQEDIPVNTDSLVNSDNAEAIPGLLKNAQQAQDQVDKLKDSADKAKQDLRDALSIAGNDQNNQNDGQQNAQA